MYPMSSGLKPKILLAVFAVFIAINPAAALSGEKEEMELVAVITANEWMGRFNQPTSLFFDETKKRLYISDTGGNRLISFDNDFLYIAEFKEKGLELPMGAVKDKKGRFFVVSGSEGAIMFLDIKEKVIKPLAMSEVPEMAEEFVPGKLTIDIEDQLYVIDKLNKRILVLDTAGTFIKEITVEDEGFYGFTDVKVDEKGNIYALDTIGRAVYLFNKEGEVVLRFGNREMFDFPISLAVDSKGLIYVVDQHQGKIKVFNMGGGFPLYELFRKGWKEGELLFPYYILIDKEDRLYVIDRGNNRIQIFK